jgi:glycosyltransferase involved in cell wall biosynthesis
MAHRRALIVDSGLRALVGHNFSYTRTVARAFEEAGLVVTVFTNKNVTDAGIRAEGYEPTFSLGRYDYPPGHGRWRDLVHLYAQSVVYADELEAALARQPRPDIVLCHTTNEMELLGWSRVCRRRDPGGALAWVEHLPTGLAGVPAYKRWLNPYRRLKPVHLARLRRRLGARFLLCTDSDALTRDYAQFHPGPVLTLPIPLDPRLFDGEAVSPRPSGRRLRVGYVGDSRSAKGFPLLPETVERLLARPGFDAELVVQCARPPGVPDTSNPAVALQALAAGSPSRVTLVEGALSSADYVSLLRSLDVVWVPAMHPHFIEGTSNVFTEAVGLGLPVVVTAGTWMAGELRKGAGGAEFAWGDAVDLAEKTAQVVAGYDEHAARARAFAPSWRAFHQPRSLVRLLLRAAGLDGAGPGEER